MTVYVDDMRAKFGRMVMCHMVADAPQELIAMADHIGVRQKWIQKPGTPQEHFDISLAKRSLAVAAGAVEITWRQLAAMVARRVGTGTLGDPATAEDWLREDVGKALDWRSAERFKRERGLGGTATAEVTP